MKNTNVLDIGVVKRHKRQIGWVPTDYDIGCNIVNELRETA